VELNTNEHKPQHAQWNTHYFAVRALSYCRKKRERSCIRVLWQHGFFVVPGRLKCGISCASTELPLSVHPRRVAQCLFDVPTDTLPMALAHSARCISLSPQSPVEVRDRSSWKPRISRAQVCAKAATHPFLEPDKEVVEARTRALPPPTRLAFVALVCTHLLGSFELTTAHLHRVFVSDDTILTD
jgi:hypothetical protein